MLKFKRTVVAGEFLNPEEAFEANHLIKLIKATLDCGVDHLFDEGWIDCKVVYANGLNGTDWDCRENYHLPIFKVFREDEDLDKANVIGIEQFAEVKLRTGEITACEKMPKAKKLLKLTVDDGRQGRQIVSGIAKWYTPEELVGKKIVFVANLAPRKLCGEESQGMILAADCGNDDIKVLFVDKDIPNGSPIG